MEFSSRDVFFQIHLLLSDSKINTMIEPEIRASFIALTKFIYGSAEMIAPRVAAIRLKPPHILLIKFKISELPIARGQCARKFKST